MLNLTSHPRSIRFSASAVKLSIVDDSDVDRAIVYQFNPDMSGTVVAEFVASPWRSCLNARINDTCFRDNLGGDYRNGRTFVASDIDAANLSACHRQLLEQFQVRANLVVPILLPRAPINILWGLLIVRHRRRDVRGGEAKRVRGRCRVEWGSN